MDTRIDFGSAVRKAEGLAISLAALLFMPILIAEGPPTQPPSPDWGYAEKETNKNRRFIVYQVIDLGANIVGLNAVLKVSFEMNLQCQPTVGMLSMKGNSSGDVKQSGFGNSPMQMQVDEMRPVEGKPFAVIYENGAEFIFPPNDILFQEMMSGKFLRVYPPRSHPGVVFPLDGLATVVDRPRVNCRNAIQ
jgi:hypothetical protein